MSVLEINDLSVNFATRDGPVVAVDKLNLRLQTGKSLGVVGESGSGKSQAMLAVLGLLANNGRAQGSVTLHGDSILGLANKDLNKIRGVQIGMVFQDPMTSLNPYLKIATQMIEVLVQHKRMPTKHARKMCLQALERVHIQQPALRLTQYPHELSGGMRQRVAIAMALLCEPKVLIADEPTTALDVTVQAEILRLIQQIRDTSQTSLVLISHDLAVVAGICDHVLVMQQGKVVEYGDVEQVFYHPKHPYTRALLASVPTLDMPSGQPLKVVGTPATRLSPVHVMPRPESVMLKVTDLRVHFPVQHGLFAKHADTIRAVDGVSFEVNSGQTLGIVGESGSGKSTLARAILGLVPLTFGVVELDGQRLSGLDTAQRRRRCREIQIIFQDPLSALNPRMTIGQILSEPLLTHFRSLGKQAISERVATVMEQVGLSPDEINRYPHEYSGGQCQRIGIARALILQPKVIICDEPVSALDVSIQAQVVNLLRDIQTEFGLTLIFIAHDISVVKNISQRMLVMHGGKVVEAGDSEQICSKPAHAYTKALLAAVPVAEPRTASGF